MSSLKRYLRVGSPLYGYILNTLFLVYAGLLPFSNAFDTHTGPYLIFLFWLLEGNFSKKLNQLRSNKSLIFLSLFFALSAISLLWSDNIHKGYKELEYYFAVTSLFLAVSISIKKEFVKAAIYIFLTSMFVSEIYSYGIFFGFFTPEGASPQNPSPPYIHHLRYSIFLAVTAVILLSKSLDEREKKPLRIFEAIFFLSTVVNLFINGGRTGQLAFIFAMFILLIYRYGFRLKTLLSTVTAITLILIAAYNLSPVFHHRADLALSDIRNISEKQNLQNSWGERIAMKIVASDMILKHPLAGEGIGDAMESYKKELHTPPLKKYAFTEHVPHVHDQYLQIAIQSGLISLILFILFLAYVWKTKCNGIIDRAMLHSVVVIFIFGFFTDVLLRNYVSGLFGFIVAVLVVKCRNSN